MRGLLLKNIVINVLYYAFTVALVPWLFLSVERRFGRLGAGSELLGHASILVGLGGIVLQLWCIGLFHCVGEGTPSPALLPRRVVIAGPYRYVRSPMNIGELLLFLALAGWFSSVALLVYTLLSWLAFHLFVVYWEEPKLAGLFGDRYVRYRDSVDRWLPRCSAYSES